MEDKITKYVKLGLKLIAVIGILIGAYYTLRDDIKAEKKIDIETAIEKVDSIMKPDSLKIDTNEAK